MSAIETEATYSMFWCGVDGDFTDAQVREHLDQCAECADQVAIFRAEQAMLADD